MLRLYADVRWRKLKLKITGPKTTLPIELNPQFPAAVKVDYSRCSSRSVRSQATNPVPAETKPNLHHDAVEYP